jgi:hypothetical protein
VSTCVVCGYENIWVDKMNISVINFCLITKSKSRGGCSNHICESRNEILIEKLRDHKSTKNGSSVAYWWIKYHLHRK